LRVKKKKKKSYKKNGQNYTNKFKKYIINNTTMFY